MQTAQIAVTHSTPSAPHAPVAPGVTEILLPMPLRERIAVLQEVRQDARKEQVKLLTELTEFASKLAHYAAYPSIHHAKLALLEPVGAQLALRFQERQAALMRLDAKLEEVYMG